MVTLFESVPSKNEKIVNQKLIKTKISFLTYLKYFNKRDSRGFVKLEDQKIEQLFEEGLYYKPTYIWLL